MDVIDFQRWLRFAAKGGIGRGIALVDSLTEDPDDLLFFKGERVIVLMKLSGADDIYLGQCKGIIGAFHGSAVAIQGKLKKPFILSDGKWQRLNKHHHTPIIKSPSSHGSPANESKTNEGQDCLILYQNAAFTTKLARSHARKRSNSNGYIDNEIIASACATSISPRPRSSSAPLEFCEDSNNNSLGSLDYDKLIQDGSDTTGKSDSRSSQMTKERISPHMRHLHQYHLLHHHGHEARRRRQEMPSLGSDDEGRLHDSEDAAFTRLTSARPLSIHVENAEVENIILRLRGPYKTEEKSRLQKLRGDAAYCMLDALQKWLDEHPEHVHRQYVFRTLIDIASASNELPPALFITGVHMSSRDATSTGSFADVFCGTYRGQKIALKRLRINDRGQIRNEIHRKFCKEGLIWRQLMHPNILPFIGVDAETFKDTAYLCLVSPWMNRGTIMDFLRSDAYKPSKHRRGLIVDVARGLEYLHGQGIAHGDLHGANIFIADDGRACLADFGLTVLCDRTLSRHATSTNAMGATRWLAPELFESDPVLSRKTPAGDVFAFGRLCLVVCTTRQPFEGASDIAVMLLVVQGVHPRRPADSRECKGHAMSDQLWDIATKCWAIVPGDRPNILAVLTMLNGGQVETIQSKS